MERTELIAYCGIWCGACSFRLACQETEREHLRAMPAKYDRFKSEPLGMPCGGCKPDPNSSGDCGIRICAKGRGLRHCGLCADFPCARLKDFAADGIPHHAKAIADLGMIAREGEAAWVEREEKRWRCQCGTRLSWYLSACPKCGKSCRT